ncbi:MAG: bifunctional hydroxymethylpyrimidine kinase/phosphomethylpyrimidine kinase [Cyanobacteria bacterium NC_groundwater_1444_Ag_S-0.65um_54_12]|nr:bifunctional hydroxymethylpyrimidine kinase/phosphomethylpyrimidine kinase [Cyanobacteria bacterium NC_groundwater_1444_Ag_S-0.65um_54_12]
MLDPVTVRALLSRMNGARILVLGDLIADEFLLGEVERISREAPVLILRHCATNLMPGGAANAAANITALRGKAEMLGIVGKDPTGRQLLTFLEGIRVTTRCVVLDPTRPTTTKTRISASSSQLVAQQIVRVDRLVRDDIAPEIEDSLIAAIEARLPGAEALLISDYRNGLLTPRLREVALQLGLAQRKLLVVDTQGDLQSYRGAAVFTPNQPEAEAAVGFPITDAASLKRAGLQLLECLEAEAILITRGANGIALFERDREMQEIPAFNRSEVFDVTGAGDTVAGTLTLALAAGATYCEAAVLANLAASQVVRRFGTSTVNGAELVAAVEQLSRSTATE